MKEELSKKTDEELVLLSQRGEKQATEALMLRHSGLVRSCARGFFLVGGETEDLLQEGMIGLYHAIGDYRQKDGGSSFKNFAYLCVSRRIIDAVKTAARKKNAPLNSGIAVDESAEWVSTGLSPEELVILSDDRREFKQKMSRVLSDFEFKVTVMYMDGLSCAEICEATGKTAKSVDNAIQRSKHKLQTVLNR